MVSNHESYGLGRVWGRSVCYVVESEHSKMDVILQMTFSKAFFMMNLYCDSNFSEVCF